MKEQIDKYNEAYRKGNALISDAEYDAMCEEFNYEPAVGAPIDSADKVKLPIQMGSLNKVKTIEELFKWNKSNPTAKFIATPKYDGIASLMHVVDKNIKAVYTRGNGIEGRNIIELLDNHQQIQDINNALQSRGSVPSNFYIIAELIMPEDVFETKYSATMKNSRNMVAGLTNRSESQKEIHDCRFMLFDMKGDSVDWDKSNKLKFLNEVNKNYLATPYLIQTSVDQSFLDQTMTMRNDMDSLVKCDGIVIEYNDSVIREELGLETNKLNPAYARAYKPQTEERRSTKVNKVEWSISKDGKVIPVAHLLPVELDGVTISKVTCYNAAYVQDHELRAGSIVEIVRSGGVIPKILRVINEDDATEF